MELKKDGLPPAVRPVLPPRRTDWTVRSTDEGAVRILLRREDVNPDQEDPSGRTPLSWAAGNGRERVVRMLFEQDVNPKQADTRCPNATLVGAWARASRGSQD